MNHHASRWLLLIGVSFLFFISLHFVEMQFNLFNLGSKKNVWNYNDICRAGWNDTGSVRSSLAGNSLRCVVQYS